jgi:hypothetical protein
MQSGSVSWLHERKDSGTSQCSMEVGVHPAELLEELTESTADRGSANVMERVDHGRTMFIGYKVKCFYLSPYPVWAPGSIPRDFIEIRP